MAKIEGGRLVAKILKQEGVERIFMLTGGHILSITQGCLDEGIEVIDSHHETAAVMMAEGWARATGKPGVVVTTAGPGVANAVPGLWTAQENGVPVVVLSGHCELTSFDTGGAFDQDTLSLVEPCTKWARTVYETRRCADYVSMAFRHALGGRPGVAYVEFPQDILQAEAEESEVAIPRKYRTQVGPQGDSTLVKEAVELLLGAEKPVVLASGGIWWSQAAKELQEFAELAQIPVAPVGGAANGSIP
ncbi:MAG: thiamine pyrophosphate-binding protein, partial [Acidimicrobiia bacterium]